MTDKIIKIERGFRTKKERLEESRYRKHVMKIDAVDEAFAHPTVYLNSTEIGKKMQDFIDYCLMTVGKCINCPTKLFNNKNNFHCSDDYSEIRALCTDCMMYTNDGSPQAREWIKWVNNVLKEYDLDFKDGFPKLMRFTFKAMCYECPVPHEKEMIQFLDFRGIK